MKIAMFTNNYKPFIAGVPVSIERLADGLRRLGHTVVVFAPDYGTGEDERDIVRYQTIYRKKSGVVVGNFLDSVIEQQFRMMDFDVIHVHHPIASGYTALYLGRKYGVPVAYTYHTKYEDYLHYFRLFEEMQRRQDLFHGLTRYSQEVLVPGYMSLFSNQCDLVFAPTEMMRSIITASGVRTQVEILPTGLEDDAFQENAGRSAALRAKYLDGRKYLFCTVSRLEKEKNLFFMLDGLLKLKEIMGGCFRVAVIGEGRQRQQLEEKARQYGLLDNLVFTGRIHNHQIKDYQFACDAFLFTSQSETQGIVMLEAMAAGNPVVAVKASGVVDVVRDGYNGYMTGESPAEWAAAVKKAVSVHEEHQRLKQGARATALGYRSIQIARRAEGCYEKIAGRRGGGKQAAG